MKRDLCKEAVEYMNTPIKVGDAVNVEEKLIYQYGKDKKLFGCVVEMCDNGNCKVKIKDSGSHLNGQIVEVPLDKLEKDPIFIGYDPLEQFENMPRLDLVAYGIGSLTSIVASEILYGREYYVTSNTGEKLLMENLNWNPYVIDKDGKKQYYQRDFCWSLEDKQSLIESIYRKIDCGKIVIREHDFEEVQEKLKNGDKEIAFFDIVDGKQRLNALLGFLQDEFPDMHGKYYSDFSTLAKRRFDDISCFTLAKMSSKTTDEDVLKVFLLVNYAGKQMSREHLDYVENILKKI